MISPELLRRYSFFAGLADKLYTEIAMNAEEAFFEKGETIFEECDEASSLYILQEGSIDLYYKSEDIYHTKSAKEFLVGEINPGEIFGVSALLEPYELNATARAAVNCSVIKIDAKILRAIMQSDPVTGYRFMVHESKALMERLIATRIQLAAAWSD